MLGFVLTKPFGPLVLANDPQKQVLSYSDLPKGKHGHRAVECLIQTRTGFEHSIDVRAHYVAMKL